MHFLGLHVVDIAIVILYFCGIIYIGKRIAGYIKNQTDFFLAGRKLGKFVQFFLNFGSMTDANTAATLCSFIFREGVASVWMGFQLLFLTPYYWFMSVWFRRARHVTIADLFEDRFGGKSLGMMYALFTIFFSIIIIGSGFLISERVIEAMMIKPASEYTTKEAEITKSYNQYQVLKKHAELNELSSAEFERYQILKNRYANGELRSEISYLKPIVFYLVYAIAIAIYVILGGFGAAAFTDVLQGFLIITFSFILIPTGLSKIGGFAGLHAKVPAHMFDLMGATSVNGEFAWYSILGVLFVTWISVHAVATNMGVAGSAKNESAARFGSVSGGFAKRIMMIAWTLCGLIAVALLGNSLSNSDNAWGALTHKLLGPGALGLMLAGMLAANMAAGSAMTMVISALFVRNLYSNLAVNRSEWHYIWVGRLAIAVVLGLGIFVAMYASGIIELSKFVLMLGVTFGAPIILLFFWRRLTKTAVIIEVITCALVIGVLPYVLSGIPAVCNCAALTIQTHAKQVKATTRATHSDVESGLAAEIGQKIVKDVAIEPVPVFFERLVKKDPYDKNSPLIGGGSFRFELYLLSRLGVNVQSMIPAQLLMARFLFSGCLPFILLFSISWLTPPCEKLRMDRFYVKMKTPIASSLEEDHLDVEKSYAALDRFDDRKLFRKSNWEFCKWDRQDAVGFGISCAMVAAILGLFWFVLNIGR